MYQAFLQSGWWTGWHQSAELATQPSLVQGGTSGMIPATRFVATLNGDAPYALPIVDPNEFMRMSSTDVTERYSRRIVVAKEQRGRSRGRDSSYFSFELSPIKLRLQNGSEIVVALQTTNDSLPRLNDDNAWLNLSSARLVLPPSIDSVIVDGKYSAASPDSITANTNGVSVSFELIDARNGRLITKVGNERTIRSSGRGNLSVRERLQNYEGREVIIRPSVKGISRGRRDFIYTLVHVHTILDDSSSVGPFKSSLQKAATRTQSNSLPTRYALHEGYPNPFNPSTQITFDLPEPSHVSLVIYDVLGRKVAELENGMKEAGYHSATWNGSAVASGVYFARFAARDAQGNVKLSKVSRLLLAK
jgi:hypothetical protein